MKSLAVEVGKDIAAGTLGAGATGGGVYVSALPHLEMWLRIASLVIGIGVGLLTGYSILISIQRKKGNREP